MSIGSFSENRASSGMFTIQVSSEDMKAFVALATLVPKAAANAQRRAINKTMRRLSTRIAQAVGKQERIAVKAVRQRLRSYPVESGGKARGKLWFGINPLEASRSGRPRQTKAGVSVGSRRYRGAFFKKVYGNQADIWIRTASKHFVRTDYPDSEVTSQTGASSGFVGENSDRFPLAKAKISLDSVRPHFEAWSRKADERLLQILRQEMNFELQKFLKGTRRV